MRIGGIRSFERLLRGLLRGILFGSGLMWWELSLGWVEASLYRGRRSEVVVDWVLVPSIIDSRGKGRR